MSSDPFNFNAASSSTTSEAAFNFNAETTSRTSINVVTMTDAVSYGTIATSATDGPLYYSSAISTTANESPFQFGSTSAPTSSPDLSHGGGSHISKGAAVGAAFGALIAVALVGLGAWLVLRQRRNAMMAQVNASKDRFMGKQEQGIVTEVSQVQSAGHGAAPTKDGVLVSVREENVPLGRSEATGKIPLPTYQQVMGDEGKEKL